MHSFSVNGLRWRRFRDDPNSPLCSQQTFGLSEAFTFTINDDGNSPYGAGEHLWRSAGIDDTWLGAWGLVRVHPAGSGQMPTLAQVVDATRSTGEHGQGHGQGHAADRGARGGPSPSMRPGASHAPVPSSPTRRYAVVAKALPLTYRRNDLGDPFGLVYQVTSMTPPGMTSPILLPGPQDAAELAPLVLRCRAGEIVEVTVRNELPANLKPEPFAPEVPIDMADGVRAVSRRVSLHADLVRTDVALHDGSRVGRNHDSTIEPGGERTYRWYADVELGPIPLSDLADVRNHRHHGLVGALVVEPEDAVPVNISHRHEGRNAPLDHQAWTGVQAIIHTGASKDPAHTEGAAHERDEVVLILQDGLRLFLDNNLAVPFPDIPADPGEADGDPEDQGQKAINYRSDPTGPQRWLSGTPTRAAHYTVPPDAEVWVHLVGGVDKPRNHSLNVHGFDWPEWPHRKDNSPHVGAEGGLTVNSARTLRLHTGSHSADHAIRSGVLRYTVGQGLWALLRVDGGNPVTAAKAAQRD